MPESKSTRSPRGASEEVRPMGVVFAVPHEEGIELRRAGPRDRLIKLDEADARFVWAVLQECDGYSSLERVVEKVHTRFPDRAVVMIRDVLDDLLEEGVLVDSRGAFPAFHQLTENPPPFGRALSAEEVIAYTRSERLPVTASGRTHEIGQLPTALAHVQAARRSQGEPAPRGRRERSSQPASTHTKRGESHEQDPPPLLRAARAIAEMCNISIGKEDWGQF
jgi:hypothetical protein